MILAVGFLIQSCGILFLELGAIRDEENEQKCNESKRSVKKLNELREDIVHMASLVNEDYNFSGASLYCSPINYKEGLDLELGEWTGAAYEIADRLCDELSNISLSNTRLSYQRAFPSTYPDAIKDSNKALKLAIEVLIDADQKAYNKLKEAKDQVNKNCK